MPDDSISVVLPVFNGERFIGEALESVLFQEDPPDKIIVVDDGSTDRTPAILARFSTRIRVVRTDNRGVAAARNRGIREATGQWIALLDADDRWPANKIHAYRTAATATPDVGLFFSDIRVISSRGRPRRVVTRAPKAGDFHLALLVENVVTTSAAMFRRDAVATVGFFREDLSCPAGAEDWDFFLRLARHYPAHHLPLPLCEYRLHPASAVRTHRRQLTEDARRVLEDNLGDAPETIRRRARASLYYQSGVRHLAALDLAEARRDLARCLDDSLLRRPARALIAASYGGRAAVGFMISARRALETAWHSYRIEPETHRAGRPRPSRAPAKP